MPMYEFACQTCGQSFEKKLRMSEVADGQRCPGCGGLETRRRFSSAVAVGVGGSSRTPVAGPPARSPFT